MTLNHHEPLRTTTNHDIKPPRTTTNHYEPPQTTTNHDIKPPQTTTNHYKPPQTTINHYKPPRTTMNHHKPPQTMTLNHHELWDTQKELCIKPYGFLDIHILLQLSEYDIIILPLEISDEPIMPDVILQWTQNHLIQL